MKKMYYLSTCSTCQKIINGLPDPSGFDFQDIKVTAITEEQLEEMKAAAGSFEALFSKRAMKYRALGLHEQELSEEDMKAWILKEYTFLKRPVAMVEGKIFIGSAKKDVASLYKALEG